MWLGFLIGSFLTLVAVGLVFPICFNAANRKRKLGIFNLLCAGVFVSSFVMFLPIHLASVGGIQAFMLSIFNSVQLFAAGCEFAIVQDAVTEFAGELGGIYQTWASVLFFIAPIFTFGFILSIFNNLWSHARYLLCFFRDVYIFSELNEKSLALAQSIKAKEPDAVIVFTDVFEDNDESTFEMMEAANGLRAICFKKDILVVNFGKHWSRKQLWFFAIGTNETENLNQSLKLIERYRDRDNTRVFVFSTSIESELLISSKDKGKVKVRRINEVQSLINRVLYERGEILFKSAFVDSEGEKSISAIVLGMGRHGTEMLKALSWFGQMDGYKLTINAFDTDPLAEEKFTALAPELMSEDYNGVAVDGEARYLINIHSGADVFTASFAESLRRISDASYVLVALGDDETNVKAAVMLRMYFERMKIHPVIQAVVYNSQQKQALRGLKNFKGQEYDIEFIGDTDSSYTRDVIIDSELEREALRRHMKWGAEEEFWNYEYNYRSSVASAIHMRARVKCGIPGADKREEELTPEERFGIESLEHRRWNAYMRAEGYVFSGSSDKSSRNDLGKMHHDLVDFASLTEEEKRKDSRVGTK